MDFRRGEASRLVECLYLSNDGCRSLFREISRYVPQFHELLTIVVSFFLEDSSPRKAKAQIRHGTHAEGAISEGVLIKHFSHSRRQEGRDAGWRRGRGVINS